MSRSHIFLLGLAGLAAACQPVPGGPAHKRPDGEGGIGLAGTAAFAQIAADETISLVGTEPFWGGTITGSRLLYTTPENQAGESVELRRFAGNNGLGFSGMLRGVPIDLAITPGTCSDGMSDRSFPFTATLKLGAEQRSGCAWTSRRPFRDPEGS